MHTDTIYTHSVYDTHSTYFWCGTHMLVWVIICCRRCCSSVVLFSLHSSALQRHAAACGGTAGGWGLAPFPDSTQRRKNTKVKFKTLHPAQERVPLCHSHPTDLTCGAVGSQGHPAPGTAPTKPTASPDPVRAPTAAALATHPCQTLAAGTTTTAVAAAGGGGAAAIAAAAAIVVTAPAATPSPATAAAALTAVTATCPSTSATASPAAAATVAAGVTVGPGLGSWPFGALRQRQRPGTAASLARRSTARRGVVGSGIQCVDRQTLRKTSPLDQQGPQAHHSDQQAQ